MQHACVVYAACICVSVCVCVYVRACVCAYMSVCLHQYEIACGSHVLKISSSSHSALSCGSVSNAFEEGMARFMKSK